MTAQDESAAGPPPDGAGAVDGAENGAEEVADALLDGAAPLDAIGGGDAGEDAAAIVRDLAAKAVAGPEDGGVELCSHGDASFRGCGVLVTPSPTTVQEPDRTALSPDLLTCDSHMTAI